MPEIQICNVSREAFGPLRRSYNWSGISIPACPVDKPFVSVKITDQKDEEVHQIDYWTEHAKHVPVVIPAEVVVRDFFANERLAPKGCFIPKGETPTAEEINNAHRTRRAYLEECVRLGDSEYSRTGRVDDIPGEYKRAVAELNVDREWAFNAPVETVECEACGTAAKRLKNGKLPILCANCKYPLDKERAIEAGLWGQKEKPAGRRPGRPKKEVSQEVTV